MKLPEGGFEIRDWVKGKNGTILVGDPPLPIKDFQSRKSSQRSGRAILIGDGMEGAGSEEDDVPPEASARPAAKPAAKPGKRKSEEADAKPGERKSEEGESEASEKPKKSPPPKTGVPKASKPQKDAPSEDATPRDGLASGGKKSEKDGPAPGSKKSEREAGDGRSVWPAGSTFPDFTIQMH